MTRTSTAGTRLSLTTQTVTYSGSSDYDDGCQTSSGVANPALVARRVRREPIVRDNTAGVHLENPMPE